MPPSWGRCVSGKQAMLALRCKLSRHQPRSVPHKPRMHAAHAPHACCCSFTPRPRAQVQLAAACASFAGVLLYNAALKTLPVRALMLWGTLLAAAMQVQW